MEDCRQPAAAARAEEVPPRPYVIAAQRRPAGSLSWVLTDVADRTLPLGWPSRADISLIGDAQLAG